MPLRQRISKVAGAENSGSGLQFAGNTKAVLRAPFVGHFPAPLGRAQVLRLVAPGAAAQHAAAAIPAAARRPVLRQTGEAVVPAILAPLAHLAAPVPKAER